MSKGTVFLPKLAQVFPGIHLSNLACGGAIAVFGASPFFPANPPVNETIK